MTPSQTESAEPSARTIIDAMRPTELESQDNLLVAKVSQAHIANQSHVTSFPFKKGDLAILSTTHCRRQGGTNTRAAKFFPCFDGPYKITDTNTRHSTVTLELPGHLGLFPVFHTSEIKPFLPNDDSLFPQRALRPPAPVTISGQQEHFIDKIVDERVRHKRLQYLVRWQGEGPEGDLWLPADELQACEALDKWQARNKSGNPTDVGKH